jgi:hypothetical protein
MTDDDRLRRLLSDAVSEIEPADRIEELRASVRPRPQVVPMSRPTSWNAASGIVATAAVIGIVAFVTHVATDRTPTAGAAGDGATATATATDTSLPSPTTGPAGATTTVYYLGHGPHGTVLYRELTTTPPGTSSLDAALRGLRTAPDDRDYRTPWHDGWLVRATVVGGSIRVAVGHAPASRPPSMTARDASEAVQQVVYTLQSAVQGRAKVMFVRHGRPAVSVLGVSTARPLASAPAAKVLSLISIGAPAEGAQLAPGSLVVSGLDNADQAGVLVRLVRGGVTYVERSLPPTGAYAPSRMYPWRVVLPTAALPPGRYTVVAANGSGGLGRDTRTVVLR